MPLWYWSAIPTSPHPLERKLATLPGILKVTCLNIDEPEEDAEE